MKRAQKTLIFALILAGSAFLIIAPSAYSQEPGPGPMLTPMPRELPAGTGFIPPLMDLSHLNGEIVRPPGAAMAAPASWDWRPQGMVTPVKNQGVCGACYSFASLANFESKLLMDSAGTFDFSENNAKECNYDSAGCGGGSFYQLANHYSQHGTVLESCDPYVAADVGCSGACSYVKTMLDWNIISGNVVPSDSALKYYIENYGPIYTSIYTGDGNDASWQSEFNSYNGSYTLYYTGNFTVNHTVLIVGWDDALVHAGGTGAWICKNSWGTGWGGTCGYGSEGGFMTIAYGSANIGQYSSFVGNWQDYDGDGTIGFYDEAGWTSSYGNGSMTSYGIARYVPSGDMYVTQVEFWVTDAPCDVNVDLYDNFNGSSASGLLASKLNVTLNEAGYHSVTLDVPPLVASGNDVYAMVRFTNDTYGYPVAVDHLGPNETGTTWMSIDGSTWYDMGTNYSVDAAIRVRMAPTLASSVDEIDGDTPTTFVLKQNYPNPFNPETQIEFSLSTASHVSITVYNVIGQEVSRLVDQTLSVGNYRASWNGTDESGRRVSSGIYFYRLETNEFVETKKMIMLK